MTTALLESWRGQYADSPRRIAERLGVLAPHVRQHWVSDGRTDFPVGTRKVRRHSGGYFTRLLSTDLLITNDIVSRHIVKGPRVSYLQTWHGTPLKLIGLDETAQSYAGFAAHRKRMLRDVANWDFLLSPSPECTRMFRSAFDFQGPVWETGYPRNDVLGSDRADLVRRSARSALGLADDTLVVLHAPTWRDDQRDATGHLVPRGVDYAEFAKLLPDGATVLARMHKNIAAQPEIPAGARVLDVSGHGDIAELYLAADVLVSDYSSAIYDFAVTGKPIILFAPDLEEYRDRIRGFYFDYEDWAPGPIAGTVEELGGLISDLDGVRQQHRKRYSQFVTKFCPHEDGHAGDRVARRLLEVIG